MAKLAVLHTVVGLVETFRALIAARYPGLHNFHVVDESLLQDLIASGPSAGINRRVASHAILAREAGASVILFTCSSTSPAVDVARQVVDIPIVKVDDAMAARAVEFGPRVGLLCTTPSTANPSSDLLRRHAAGRGRQVEVTIALHPEALAARLAGDLPKHDAILTAAAEKLAVASDVLVLAQASLAHLAAPLEARLGRPVLASPALAVEALAEHLRR